MIRNLAHLEAYYWIARLGSFHAAARRLRLTQPTISNRIKELEKGLGFELFKRTGRIVRITPQGAGMFEYVERILSLVQGLEGHARIGGPLRGLLRFGAPDSFALLCLADLLRVIERDHAGLNVAVTVDNSRVLTKKLVEGELDVAILAQPESIEDLHVERLGFQEVAWVASPNFPLPSRRLRPKDLVSHQIFTNPSPSNLFSILMDWFGESGLAPPRMSSCNSVAAIAGLISAEAGISVLPTCVLERELASGALVRLNVRPIIPPQQVFAAYPKGAVTRAVPQIIHATRAVVENTRFLTS